MWVQCHSPRLFDAQLSLSSSMECVTLRLCTAEGDEGCVSFKYTYLQGLDIIRLHNVCMQSFATDHNHSLPGSSGA